MLLTKFIQTVKIFLKGMFMEELLVQLKNFKPFDEDEKHQLGLVSEFLQQGKTCFYRENPQGHITAGALVCDRQGNVLLNHHKKANMWFQFGGHADGETDPLVVAKKEVFEEAGITQFEVFGNKIFNICTFCIPACPSRNEPEHIHYDINYLFLVDNHYFKLSNESLEAKWVSVDEARKLVSKSDKGTHRMLDKYELLLNSKQIC